MAVDRECLKWAESGPCTLAGEMTAFASEAEVDVAKHQQILVTAFVASKI
jgi:hypothetical protein